jgi:hypothetical protein
VPGSLSFQGETISLTFDKYIDKTSFQQSCFISPPAGRLAYEWSGKEVEIKLGEKLRDSTTYVLTVGTDVKDTRNNRLAEAFSLAFSTGSSIDSGSVTGNVLDAKPEGVMIYAFRLDRMNPDTLDPSHTLPDYLTQTGTGGRFRLTNLASGRYRILAIRDQYKNLTYDCQIDEYGVLREDVTLGAKKRELEGMNFQLTKEDTTPPVLTSARALDRHMRSNSANGPFCVRLKKFYRRYHKSGPRDCD